ncbi:MAG: hypothetical protein ACJAX5_003367 [Patiriisocius sp.]|jgi:uncharacterized protein with NRDE domain
MRLLLLSKRIHHDWQWLRLGQAGRQAAVLMFRLDHKHNNPDELASGSRDVTSSDQFAR